jgi:hypothetical protein
VAQTSGGYNDSAARKPTILAAFTTVVGVRRIRDGYIE